MQNAKPYEISKYLVLDAFQRVKANPGSAGLDCVSIVDYESSLKDNLYILWNRMSSGSYFPPSVKLVSIPKSQGGTRPLGIPRVEDRIAQQVVVMPLVLSPTSSPTPMPIVLVTLLTLPYLRHVNAAGTLTGCLIWTFANSLIRLTMSC